MTTENNWEAHNAEIIACRVCPRLVAWREHVARVKRRAFRDCEYWGRPVPGFGDHAARLLIVGLAPGAHGSNRSGRMFTGDSSGDTLYAALYRAGFANQADSRHPGDGLRLTDVFIAAVARCAPPANRPTPAEMAACRHFLVREWQMLGHVRVVVALGQIAFDQGIRLISSLGYQTPKLRFSHGLHCEIPGGTARNRLHLLATYHPSRQNTQTGRLTPEMLDRVFGEARTLLSSD